MVPQKSQIKEFYYYDANSTFQFHILNAIPSSIPFLFFLFPFVA